MPNTLRILHVVIKAPTIPKKRQYCQLLGKEIKQILLDMEQDIADYLEDLHNDVSRWCGK